jgi:hypothetical protein
MQRDEVQRHRDVMNMLSDKAWIHRDEAASLRDEIWPKRSEVPPSQDGTGKESDNMSRVRHNT